jgi:transcriptional regulator NrdR family protein
LFEGEELAMKCPECAEVMQTKDTRQWRDIDREFDWVERRKICPACKHRMMTMEVPKSVWAKYTEEA